MRHKRQLAAGLAVAAAGAFLAVRSAPSAEAQSLPSATPLRTLTLVTGDRVTVVGDVTDEAGRGGVALALAEVQGTELIFDRASNTCPARRGDDPGMTRQAGAGWGRASVV